MDEGLKFLEISLPAADVQGALDWYRALGFTELTTADIRQWHYAVVSDGEICLGLHGSQIDQCGLTFVRPELADYVRSREAAGAEFDVARIGIDDFHEALLRDPVGNCAVLVEARTFSSAPDIDPPLLGTLTGVKIPCSDPEASAEFWGNFGFISVQSADQDGVELHAADITLLLEPGIRELTLTYQPADSNVALAELAQRGITARNTPHGKELRAPDGTRIILGSEGA